MKKRRLVKLHLLIFVTLVLVFFTLGWLDKRKLEKATITWKPELIFAHHKFLAKDGGSVIWESFFYDAYESRRMEVTKINKTSVIDGFQGVSWRWKYHNLLWILALVTISYIYQLQRKHVGR